MDKPWLEIDGSQGEGGGQIIRWSLALSLLTGTPVFQGRSAVEILAHHLHTPPQPPSARLGTPVPASLEKLVLRCLAKSPDDRPPSAQALRDYLGGLSLADACSDDDATRWWLRYRRAAAAPAAATAG